MRTVLLLGPDLSAVSGVSTHLNLILGSALQTDFRLLHFRVGSEGRRETVLGKIWRAVASPWQLSAFIIRHRPDIVHINMSMDAKAFWRDLVYLIVARLCQRKIVLQVHGGALPHDFVAGRPFFAHFLRWVLRLPDLVLLLASAELEAYRSFAPGLPAKVVANAVETEWAQPDRRTSLADGGDLRLVYIGRLVGTKGLFEAIDAVGLLRDEGTRVEFAIAGSGPDEKRLRSRVTSIRAPRPR